MINTQKNRVHSLPRKRKGGSKGWFQRSKVGMAVFDDSSSEIRFWIVTPTKKTLFNTISEDGDVFCSVL